MKGKFLGAPMKRFACALALAACGSGTNKMNSSGGDGPGSGSGTDGSIGACAIFPANFIFNSPIDTLPVDPSSGAYLTTIGGTTKIHLDLGQQTDQTQPDFYGIPFNVVHGNGFVWPPVGYAAGGAMDESDCGTMARTTQSPCPASPGYQPVPSAPIVEGGINSTPGDHHLIMLDADTCRLWENDSAYMTSGQWTVYSSATWDLKSNALRTDTWTSADAAGFPILPLLLRADEASSGTISHAVRVTFNSTRKTYVWPARHQAGGTTSTSVTPMGQLFRLKSSYQIPSTYGTQSKAILQALKTYGMYVADNGSDMYIQGEPSAGWADNTFSEVQSVAASNFEAVDITAITSRSGFDPNSGAVP
jgi:hypothetical protein